MELEGGRENGLVYMGVNKGEGATAVGLERAVETKPALTIFLSPPVSDSHFLSPVSDSLSFSLLSLTLSFSSLSLTLSLSPPISDSLSPTISDSLSHSLASLALFLPPVSDSLSPISLILSLSVLDYLFPSPFQAASCFYLCMSEMIILKPPDIDAFVIRCERCNLVVLFFLPSVLLLVYPSPLVFKLPGDRLFFF